MLSVPSIAASNVRSVGSHHLFRHAAAKVGEKGSDSRLNVASRLLENIISAHICHVMSMSDLPGTLYIHHQTRLGDVLNNLPETDSSAFLKVICHLAYLRTTGNMLDSKQLSIVLLHIGYGALGDIRLFDLIDNRTVHSEDYGDGAGNSFSFLDSSIQHFLAAVYLLSQPIMKVIEFIKEYIMVESSDAAITDVAAECMCALQYYFGLADCKIVGNPRGILTNIISFLCQYIHTSQPIVDDKVALLVINCLYQAHDKTHCVQVNHEFQRQIFSYNITLMKECFESFSFFLKSTCQPNQPMWVVYCMEEGRGRGLASDSVSIVVNVHLTKGDRERLVISNKNLEYLRSVLVPSDPRSLVQRDHSMASSGDAVHVMAPGGRMLTTPTTDPASQDKKEEVALRPYGYLSKPQLESHRRISVVTYFNIVKDLMAPQLQLHSHTLVTSQYRKSDHIWFSFPVGMRHKFYENVAITPYVPLHWVKVCYTGSRYVTLYVTPS